MTEKLELEPVPVYLVNGTENEAAQYASWSSYDFAGTEQVVQILPQNTKRKRATILVFGDSPGRVYIGTSEQCQAKAGGILKGGAKVTHSSSRAMYVMPDGTNPMLVTVLDEGYTA